VCVRWRMTANLASVSPALWTLAGTTLAGTDETIPPSANETPGNHAIGICCHRITKVPVPSGRIIPDE
jgi:hypothetical protein